MLTNKWQMPGDNVDKLPALQQREVARKAIEKDVQAYLKAGGKITQVAENVKAIPPKRDITINRTKEEQRRINRETSVKERIKAMKAKKVK